MKSQHSVDGPRIAPYGTWNSPITAELVTSQVVGLSDVQLDADNIYWVEQRPSEKGRSVVVRRSKSGELTDLVPSPFNARTRVHEYGGGAYLAYGNRLYFSNHSDNGIYFVDDSGDPVLLTQLSAERYADFTMDWKRNRLACVMERHESDQKEPLNALVSINLTTGAVDVLESGADFYATPRLSPDGSRISWLSWDHPHMPWDSTRLWIADIERDGFLTNRTLIAGGSDESVFQPSWSPDGVLYYVSDRDGWWNLYRSFDGIHEAVWTQDAEFGVPQWVFGQSTYGFAADDTIIATYTQNGVWRLASIETNSGRVTEIEAPYTYIHSLAVSGTRAGFVGASETEMPEVVMLDLSAGKYEVLKHSSLTSISPRYISTAEAIEFPTAEGLTAFANYYPPKNDDYVAADGELPPLLVACHGGPTSASYSQLNLGVEYWTSRGFAYVQVNYGGSTGYGREYHERLNGNWGVVDVQDSINCALYLADVGKADSRRLTIHGGSAGGYTALCALTFHEVFAAGASLYGVSDLEALATDTHKFESRYLDLLVGPYPESKAVYFDRSPIHFADRLSSPIIFFQGLDDKVVPPDQAVKMVDALKALSIPVAYVPFEGEGHGFRKSESIKRCLEAHLYFYASVFGIELAEPIAPVKIYGLQLT